MLERLDHLVTVVTQPGIARLHAPVADEIATIVSQLDHAHAAFVKPLDAIEILAERRSLLKAVDHAALALALRAQQVIAFEHEHEDIGPGNDLLVPRRNRIQREPKSGIVEPEGAAGCETQA